MLLWVAVYQTEHFAHKGGTEVKGEGVQRGEGREGVREGGGGALGVGTHDRGG